MDLKYPKYFGICQVSITAGLGLLCLLPENSIFPFGLVIAPFRFNKSVSFLSLFFVSCFQRLFFKSTLKFTEKFRGGCRDVL